jgi:DnaJ-class molecular chaperone
MSTNINSKAEACQILGVSTNATEKEIEKAYKKLSLK